MGCSGSQNTLEYNYNNNREINAGITNKEIYLFDKNQTNNENEIKEKKNVDNKKEEKEDKELIKLNSKMKEYENFNEKFKNMLSKFNENLTNHNVLITNNIILIDIFDATLQEANNSLNLSITDLDFEESISKKIDEQNNEYNKLKSDIDDIQSNISNLKNIYESINNKIKNINNNIDIIEQILTEKNEAVIQNSIILDDKLSNDNSLLSKKVDEFKKMVNDLEADINSYQNKKEEINKNLNNIQTKINEYKNNIENIHNIIKEETNKKEKLVPQKFIQNSMLVFNKDNPNDIYKSNLIFDKNIEDDVKRPSLLYKKWNEKCYIYNEYDIHEINFELKAVGLFGRIRLNNCLIGVGLDTSIEILEFKIDEQDSKAEYKNNSIRFNISLGNGESNKIYLKYKEIPLLNGLTEGEKNERKIFRCRFYGIKSYLKNQNAKFTLYNKSDFEIISFEDEFLAKSDDNGYTWGGEVPPNGKRTLTLMSKLEGKFHFEIIEKIENINKEPIKNEKLFVPFFFEGGNNNVTNLQYSSKETEQIEKKENLKLYEINFVNIEDSFAKFTIKCEITNKCKGEWKCDLTDNELEEVIPKDVKENYEKFKELSERIIKEYNEGHKNDLVRVSEMVKIGKWVKKNIKFNINYRNEYDITATQTLNSRIGSSYHIAQLYNALMYSLKYKCVCVSGYYATKSNIYNQNDEHFWSLIKVNDKWLPFDACMGIFTGKLPISYVFSSYFIKNTTKEGSDNVKITERIVHGKILE